MEAPGSPGSVMIYPAPTTPAVWYALLYACPGDTLQASEYTRGGAIAPRRRVIFATG